MYSTIANNTFSYFLTLDEFRDKIKYEHPEIEQTYVLEGSLKDEEGEVTAGNYVWRPPKSRHVATSPKGALILSFFLKPNIFLEEKELE